MKILGARISEISSYKEAYTLIIYAVHSNESLPNYVTINNVHTVVESVLHNDYLKVINNSFMSFPDGRPLSIVAKLKGEKNITRIFGPTFFEKTLEWGQKDGLKHFFFGSTEATINKMLKKISTNYPKTIIAGYYSPPYKKEFSEDENEKFIKIMNESGADIFWIGLGAPKQEIWMYENYKKLSKGIMIGIGAGFDYLAGNTKHAPQWMKTASLEWFYRLIQEPKRLWKRYLITNTLFVWYVFLELTGLKKFD